MVVESGSDARADLRKGLRAAGRDAEHAEQARTHGCARVDIIVSRGTFALTRHWSRRPTAASASAGALRSMVFWSRAAGLNAKPLARHVPTQTWTPERAHLRGSGFVVRRTVHGSMGGGSQLWPATPD
jgi:hypothetical protein